MARFNCEKCDASYRSEGRRDRHQADAHAPAAKKSKKKKAEAEENSLVSNPEDAE
jgi:hypothetical protein